MRVAWGRKTSWLCVTVLTLGAACAESTIRWQEVEGTELTIQAGQEVVLDASSIFADSGRYHWRQVRGPTVPIIDPSVSVLRFIAPDVSVASSVVLSLTNVRGMNSATTIFTVTVLPKGFRDSGIDAATDAQIDSSSDGSQPVAEPGQYIAKGSETTPTIDGALSEFAGAPAIDLTVSDTGSTAAVKLLRDGDSLYIAADVIDADVQTTVGARDEEVWFDDSVEFMFDPGSEGGADFNTGDFKIIVSAAGVQRDTEGTPAGEFDTSWNPDYQLAAVPTANGYRIEMAVPWSAFGLAEPPSAPWGFDTAQNDRTEAGSTSTAVWWNDDDGTINNPDGWGELVF